MKNKKIISFAIVLSFLLTGCNINSVPDITQADNTSFAETETYNETDPVERTTSAASITSVTLAQTSDTSVKSAETTAETDEETNSEVSTPQDVIVDPITEPVPVETNPPAVTTTTTPAPVVEPAEPSPPTIYGTSADGVLASSNARAALDYSNTKDGYVMAKYSGSNSTVKVQVKNPDGSKAQVYTLKTRNNYEAIPLTAGNGQYTIIICEAVQTDKGIGYASVLTETLSVSLSNSLAPFLRPSNYVPFSYGDSAVTKSSQLCGGTSNDLEKVDRVYSWLVDNVTYDKALAASVKAGYVCDTEKVINQKTGICLDYAGTMAAMLRSQNIPTQVVVGHTSGSTVLHAWVNVYVTDVGWIYGAIYFDGSAWHRMDPTFAASSKSSDSIIQYIGNGSNYVPENLY